MVNAGDFGEQSEKKVIRRAPSLDIKISNLKPDMGRVALLGTIISKNEDISAFMLDDGEAQVLILLNNIKDFEKVSEGQKVRVFGKVWGQEGELEIQADVIQDFSKVDMRLYKRAFYE